VPIIATAGEGKSFTPAPIGVHQAVCVDVIDKGIVEVIYQSQSKRQHKIDVAWQIDELRDDGKPFLVFKRYTLSLNEKASLRRDLESWRGRPFTRDEERGFDVETVVGANCLINIQHNVRGDHTYANVISIMPLAKGMQKLHARQYDRVKDRQLDGQSSQIPAHDDVDFQMPEEDAIPFRSCAT
jgi:hypothetical protein